MLLLLAGAVILPSPLFAQPQRAQRAGMLFAWRVLMNPKNPSATGELKDLQTAAQALGRKLHVQNASSEGEIDAAFASFASERVSALTFAADAVFNSRRRQIIMLAARHKLPTMYFLRDFADDGGLMSYGGSPDDAYRLAGAYAGRILKARGRRTCRFSNPRRSSSWSTCGLRRRRASGFRRRCLRGLTR